MEILCQNQVPLHQQTKKMGTQLGDTITSGKQIKGPSDIQVSDSIGLTKSKQKSFNQAESYQFNGQQSMPNAETYTSIAESSINEDNMEAFYASIEAETNSVSGGRSRTRN